MCPTPYALAISTKGRGYTMSKDTIKNKVSVRLSHISLEQIEAAKQSGYTISQFINQCIEGSEIKNLHLPQTICPHLCILQEHIDNIEDKTLRDKAKEETHKIWLALK